MAFEDGFYDDDVDLNEKDIAHKKNKFHLPICVDSDRTITASHIAANLMMRYCGGVGIQNKHVIIEFKFS